MTALDIITAFIAAIAVATLIAMAPNIAAKAHHEIERIGQ